MLWIDINNRQWYCQEIFDRELIENRSEQSNVNGFSTDMISLGTVESENFHNFSKKPIGRDTEDRIVINVSLSMSSLLGIFSSSK